MAETATGLFRDLPTGAKFRIPYAIGVRTKVDADDHNAEQHTPTGIICSNIPWYRGVRQDAYTEEAQCFANIATTRD